MYSNNIYYWQAIFDIVDFEHDYVWQAMDDHLCSCFKDYRYRIQHHWYDVVWDQVVEAARQRPYDSINIEEWAVICCKYEDPVYQVSDFILLTETWTTDTTPIDIDGFQVRARVNVEGQQPKPYGSLVAVSKSRLMSLEDFVPIEILKKTNDSSISVSGFTAQYISVLCIYKSPKADIYLLENLIESILLQKHGRVIVAGDFNIDFTSIPSPFRDLLSKLNLTSALPVEIATTTKHCTFIDNIFPNFKVKHSRRYISYSKSNHDPLYVNFE